MRGKERVAKWMAGAAALLGTLVLSSTPSSANDYYFNPGVTCRHLSGGTYKRWYGSVMNSSTSDSMVVHCPLVNGFDAVLSVPQIRVYDRHPTEDVSCTVFATTVSTNSHSVDSDTLESSGSSQSTQTLNYGADFVGHYHYVECTIPPRYSGEYSHVLGIGAYEN